VTFLVLGARLLLAVVFAVAGWTKFRGRAAFERLLTDAGWSAGRAVLAGRVLPPTELIVALLLLYDGTALWAARASIALLLAFSAAAFVIWRGGQVAPCGCFGETSAEPIGPPTFLRNAGLIGAALLASVPRPDARLSALPELWASSTADERVLVAACGALLVMLAASMRAASRVRGDRAALTTRVATLEKLRLETLASSESGGLQVGATAPPFLLPRLEGDRASLESLLDAAQPLLLIFSDASCPACNRLWPEIQKWQAEYTTRARVAVVCAGSPQMLEMKLFATPVDNVLLAGDQDVAALYDISLKPSAVLVGADGRIASRTVTGIAGIRELAGELGRQTVGGR
jgi:uncharacterized membrane protein YphA (DoxX/SURF4 family)